MWISSGEAAQAVRILSAHYDHTVFEATHYAVQLLQQSLTAVGHQAPMHFVVFAE